MRRHSAIAPDWWDYTTLNPELTEEAARLRPRDLIRLSRRGFTVVFYDTLEEFYLAEALESVLSAQPAGSSCARTSSVVTCALGSLQAASPSARAPPSPRGASHAARNALR